VKMAGAACLHPSVHTLEKLMTGKQYADFGAVMDDQAPDAYAELLAA